MKAVVYPQASGDLGVRTAPGGVQHDLRPQPVPPVRLRSPDPFLQRLALRCGQRDRHRGRRHAHLPAGKITAVQFTSGHRILARAGRRRRHDETRARHPGLHPQLHHPATTPPRQRSLAQLGKVEFTCRGGFAYAAGVLPGGEHIPLFRLRYGGSAHSFGFALYSHANERYEDALLLTGSPTGTPQEALTSDRSGAGRRRCPPGAASYS
jgi:hypothetical protein